VSQVRTRRCQEQRKTFASRMHLASSEPAHNTLGIKLLTLLLKTIRDQKSRDLSCVPPRYPMIQTFRLISQTCHQLSHAFCLSIVPPTPPQSGTRPSSLAKCLTLVETRALVRMWATIPSVGQ